MSQAVAAAGLHLVTADELLRMPDDGVRRELVRGEVREMSPAGSRHGRIGARILSRLEAYVREQGLGEVYNADTGFLLASNPDTVRAPDVGFVSRERADPVGDIEEFWPGAPDLAIEVVSPSDLFSEVDEKVAEYLDAGCRMVMVVDPRRRAATVYRSRSDIVLLTENDSLEGGDVVPGWTLPLRDVFPQT
ncbi:Uma2 family endonuclease [Longimicrobium sp.]|uniref:Uma2 family endonuclease n=1 Tax=Longimicrobium sp. TaxID=2029185 RepID=UPI002C239977|nr:Uma2 family endonuclease [Longimicrobium sp.]HSU18077.1 Uma2 family endonuclease [Longimicrobium sp.]